MNQFSDKKYDLEERTANFGKKVISFYKQLEQTAISRPLISQIVRSSTSVGANYMEANSASSKKDFTNKIYICKKESQETKHWTRMLAECFPEKREHLKTIWQETQELTMIFQKITSSLNH